MIKLKQLRRISILMILFFGISLLTISVFAEEGQNEGEEIMQRILERESWNSMQSLMTLKIISKQGKERTYKLESHNKTFADETNKSMMIFVDPPDAEDTRLLTFDYPEQDDDMWIYIPQLRASRRIAASGRGGSFMNSDFSYEDIGAPNLEDFNYRLLGSESIEGQEYYKIECIPVTDIIARNTGYGKIIRWVRKDIEVIEKSLYFNRAGQELKEGIAQEIKQIEGIWFPIKQIMNNIKSGQVSIITFDEIKVNVDIDDKYFSQRYLEKGR